MGLLKKLAGGVLGGSMGASAGALFGMGGSSPSSPDFMGAARAQGDENRKSALYSSRLSNPNVTNPFGQQSVTYGEDGTASVNQTYTPELQNIFNQRFGAQGGVAGQANQAAGNLGALGIGGALDTASLPAQMINPGQTAQDAIMARLQPQIDRNRSMRTTELANQGIMPGSEAYKNAIGDLGQQENDLYTQAALKGIDVGNQARQQALSEQVTGRQLPMQEILQMLSGSNVAQPQFPGFQGQNVAPTDIMGATQAQAGWDADMYNAKQAQKSSTVNGLFGLGGAAMMFSDRRLKTDIEFVGELESGVKMYSFRYIWSVVPQTGFMADEVQSIYPEAVYEVNGFKMVDTSKVH